MSSEAIPNENFRFQNLMGIKLKNITFKQDRAIIDVQCSECLTPIERAQLKALLYKKYPNIKNHACKNSKGPTFDDCVETTSLAHIFEHIILEELKMVSDIGEIFVAKTSKVSDTLAKIELKYYDDILTLQAVRRASESLNELISACKE